MKSNDVLALVRSGVLRGLSIEFSAQAERLEEGDLADSRAGQTQSAIGVVDRPQCSTSTVQARRRGGSFLKAGVPYGKSLDCRCHSGQCNKVQFEPETFAETLADPENEVLAIVGEYSGAIASRRRGSMILKSTRDGLEITILEAARTDAARDLAEMAKVVPIYARPVFADPLEFTESGAGDAAIATYRKARLRAILIGPTDADGRLDPGGCWNPPPSRRRLRSVGGEYGSKSVANVSGCAASCGGSTGRCHWIELLSSRRDWVQCRGGSCRGIRGWRSASR